MLIRKLFKRPKAVPFLATKAAVVPQLKPESVQEHIYNERRKFPRPLPVPEVLEKDWNTWVEVTQEKKS